LFPYVHTFDASPEKASPLIILQNEERSVRHKKDRHNDETGIESSKIGSVGGLEVTRELVKRAGAKLVGLHAQRSQLQKRIRALHYLLKTKDTEFVHSAQTGRSVHRESVKPTINRHERSKIKTASETAAISRIDSKRRARGSALPGVSIELRRACRIALMETDHPQPCEQILRRIHRRKSVCMGHFRDPVIAVTQELRAMLADGEVIQTRNKQLWQMNRDAIRLIIPTNLQASEQVDSTDG
jgi:hypothetical protein